MWPRVNVGASSRNLGTILLRNAVDTGRTVRYSLFQVIRYYYRYQRNSKLVISHRFCKSEERNVTNSARELIWIMWKGIDCWFVEHGGWLKCLRAEPNFSILLLNFFPVSNGSSFRGEKCFFSQTDSHTKSHNAGNNKIIYSWVARKVRSYFLSISMYLKKEMLNMKLKVNKRGSSPTWNLYFVVDPFTHTHSAVFHYCNVC